MRPMSQYGCWGQDNEAEANDTNEANGPMIWEGCRFDEANDATADEINEANVSDEVKAN